MFDPKTKILIVDDQPAVIESIVAYCKHLGLTNLHKASDGKEAWERIQKESPPFELILSDWSMPHVSGLELLQRFRANTAFANIPFLMVTGLGETRQIVEALTAGATNYLVKPFSYQTLKEKLETIHAGYKSNLSPKKTA